jgi:hypothetical protein
VQGALQRPGEIGESILDALMGVIDEDTLDELTADFIVLIVAVQLNVSDRD